MGNVRDLIPDTELDTWIAGDNVCIVAGTGTGKSYFIKTGLVEYARQHGKKILFLVHRTILKEQIQVEVDDMEIGDVFTVETYQFVELLKKDKEEVKLDYFDYIVADEFHYFLADSSFNTSTEISLGVVMKAKGIKIYMSATPNDMIEYFETCTNLEIKKYELPMTFDFISSLTFIYGVDRIKEATYKTMEQGKKTIIFTNAGDKRMKSLKKEFPNSITYASPSNGKLYATVDPEKIDEMVRDMMFEEDVLITTTAMDAGVSLFDRNIQTIILDVREMTDIIQCLGRKRIIDEDDKIDLFVVVPPNVTMKNDLERIETILDALDCIDNNVILYLKKYHARQNVPKQLHSIVEPVSYGSTVGFKYSQLTKYKLQLQVKELREFQESTSMGQGFIDKIHTAFNKKEYAVLRQLSRSYTSNNTKEYREQRKALVESNNAKEEELRIKKAMLAMEEDDFTYNTIDKYCQKKIDTHLTDKEKEILFKDISKLAMKDIKTLPKANEELERFGLKYKLEWKSIKIRRKTVKRAFLSMN